MRDAVRSVVSQVYMFWRDGKEVAEQDECVMSRWFVVLALRCVSFSIVVHNRCVGYEAI